MKYDDEIKNEYFDWMYRLVFYDRYYTKISYRKLMIFLHNTTFIALHPMDDNRRVDGINLRYKFGVDCGYSRETIEDSLFDNDCSVLEMMVALAYRGEDQIMSDIEYGNRIGQWFWSMIVSLGLGQMNDLNFDQHYCQIVIDNFLNRNYSPHGEGGLFTLDHPIRDLRDVEIWCQFMWYLDEIIEILEKE